VERYVIAVRREARRSISSDWPALLKEVEDLTVVGDDNPNRIVVDASPDAIERLRARLGTFVHIEPLIPHHPS
jgi:hypothetical protein